MEYQFKSLSLKNFKSWRSIENMRFAPITGLFGTNSSGKSSIIQFLLMLKQTVDAPDDNIVLDLGTHNEKALVDLGSFREIIFNNKGSNSISFDLSWCSTITGRSKNAMEDAIKISCKIGNIVNRLKILDAEYYFNGTTITYLLHDDGKHFFQSKDKEGNTSDSYTSNSPPSKFFDFGIFISPEPSFTLDSEFTEYALFEDIYYLGPLRDLPKREYRIAGYKPKNVGKKGENTIFAMIASREDREIDEHNLEQKVAECLKSMKLIKDLKIKKLNETSHLYDIRVKTSESSNYVQLPDVGTGISQILPVIVQLYYVPKGSIVILEHPELHLHPFAQAELADVIIDAVKERDLQLIFESHSEHLLLRLQRRIAEEELAPDDTALYFCEMEGGESRLLELAVNEYGIIKNWPENFFGDEMGERHAMIQAGIKRKKQNKK